jgi:hypothetical protein
LESPLYLKNFRRLSLFVVLYFLVTSCDAPHLNALDPSSPAYDLGQLSGIVSDISNQPLQYVKVIWKNQNTITTTDSLGKYVFKEIKIKSGWLTFERNEYVKDSVYVNWENQKNISVDPKRLVKNIGTLDGFVYTSSTPGAAISNVKVVWKEQNIITETDNSGYFKFESIPTSDGYLTFDKDGFVTDSTYVQWNKQTVVRIQEKRLNFSKGRVWGYVKSVSRNPISNASVTLKGKNIVVQTNSIGYYKIDNLQYQNDTLLFQAKGYSSVVAPLNWVNTSDFIQVDSPLMNANPKLNDLRIYSSIENYYDRSVARLYVQTKVTDEDIGDIDSVFVCCTELNNLRKQLQYNPSTGYFETSLEEESTYLSSIEDAIGKFLKILVKDKENRSFSIDSSYVKRIIRNQITFDSPANLSKVQQKPTLKWKKFSPGFNFKYLVQVFTAGIVQQQPVWQKDLISQDDVEVLVTTALTPGQNYYWVIWCIDDYQNRSRSKPATFVVQ